MNSRFRIATFATLALFFLALVFGARLAVRGIAAPFDGIERFARASRAPAPSVEPDYEETIRKIDWDAPVAPAAPAAKVKGSVRTTPQSSATHLEEITAGEFLIEATPIEQKEGALEIVLTDVSFTLLPLRHEPDLEALASALKLTDAQKASVSALIDWRKWSIDALTDLKADEESMERVNQSYREAMTSLLDAAQAKKYGEMSSGASLVSQTRIAVTLAFKQVGNEKQSDDLKAYLETNLKAAVEKRKTE